MRIVLRPEVAMPRHISAAISFSDSESAAARHHIEEFKHAAWFCNWHGRKVQENPASAHFRHKLAQYEADREFALAQLGSLSVEAADAEAGDTLTVSGERFLLEDAGREMKILIGDRWEACPALVARHLGPAEPEGDDTIDSELPERRHEYAELVRIA